mgnify:CR=1 FL=1
MEDYPERKGEAFKNQVMYTTADGGEIPNLGEKFQLADVRKPLIAVSALTAKGHKVEFDTTGGWIRPSKGQPIRFQKQNGVYMMELLDLKLIIDSSQQASSLLVVVSEGDVSTSLWVGDCSTNIMTLTILFLLPNTEYWESLF